jgi:hypothetical protein
MWATTRSIFVGFHEEGLEQGEVRCVEEVSPNGRDAAGVSLGRFVLWNSWVAEAV